MIEQKELSLFDTAKDGDCAIATFHNETGTGTITSYQVFPGIYLMFNDFHIAFYQETFLLKNSLFCIDHCLEGRMEYERSVRNYAYMEPGNVKLDPRLNHEGLFTFPLMRYLGLTIVFKLPESEKTLFALMENSPIDLLHIKKKFCTDGWPIVIQDVPAVTRIIGELYSVPKKIRLPFFKVKILELLLCLEVLKLPEKSQQPPYFYQVDIKKIKGIHRLLTQNLQNRYTLELLAQRFEMSLTTMKTCFKAVYGKPINTYMRMYRMNQAAVYLKEEQKITITNIAGLVGYESASKFSAAFKRQFGETPLAYRKNNSRTSIKND